MIRGIRPGSLSICLCSESLNINKWTAYNSSSCRSNDWIETDLDDGQWLFLPQKHTFILHTLSSPRKKHISCSNFCCKSLSVRNLSALRPPPVCRSSNLVHAYLEVTQVMKHDHRTKALHNCFWMIEELRRPGSVKEWLPMISAKVQSYVKGVNALEISWKW